jgi:hypothetical protein
MDPVENKHDFPFARCDLQMVCFAWPSISMLVLWRMTLLFVILKSINVGTVQTNVNSKAPWEHQGESSLERLEKHLAGSRQPLSTNQPCVDEVT